MSSLDPQLFEMIQQRFDTTDAKLDALGDTLATHVAKDDVYWKVVDRQQAQLGVLRRLFWGIIGVFGAVGAWFTSK